MTRFDPRSLASHIEWALSCAPCPILAALRDDDALTRRLAMIDLAEFVAGRLSDIEPRPSDLGKEQPLPLAIGMPVM